MEQQQDHWHSLPAEQVAQALGSDYRHGLSATEHAQRLKRFGPNRLPEGKRRSSLLVFLQQFQSPLIYILFIAAAIAFALGKRGDAGVILVVVFINSVIGWFQEGRAERAMAALRRLSSPQARVLRDGREQLIDTAGLVPGDVLLLAAGDGIDADARLLQANALETAEATLTGESLPVAKQTGALPSDTLLADRSNMVYAGTHVTAGRGLALVTSTGSASEVGRIAELTESSAAPKTPLELAIAQFGRYLVAGAIVLFLCVMGLGLLRGIDLTEIFMVAISQMVSMVPEGLPVAMTIALAVGMQRMAGHGAIVRRLAAVETLGSTSVICSDKTGTLTRNEMTVTAMWLPPGRFVDVEGVGYQPQGALLRKGQPLAASELSPALELIRAGTLCNDARLQAPERDGELWRPLGDPTEAALLTLAAKGGIDSDALRKEWPRIAELPFDPTAGMMAVQIEHAGARQVLCKGAPEQVLRRAGFIREDGRSVALNQRHRAAVERAAQGLADRALRVLALARWADGCIDEGRGFEQLDGKLEILGLVGQMDPPREEVKDAVLACQQAGMRAVMVTGDHKQTGLAIARALGIADSHHLAIDGGELAAMSEAELSSKLNDIAVFARVQPAQKLQIIEALQARGEVGAMTGDGVNDAPALVRADVGVAMGVTGTEVAKSAADIVITDDNFATIVDAVAEGRLVHRNLRKVILYLFATSMAEIAVLMAALLAGYPLPLAAVQILWINIVTEGTVTVNLIMEPPEGNEMRERPVARNRPLLSMDLLKRVALMTPLIALSTFAWFSYRLAQGLPHAQVQTETFTVLAACQWFNVLNCQSATRSVFSGGLARNPWMAGGLLLSILLQAIVIYWPAMQGLFHTVPIAGADLLRILAVASLVLWVEEFRKWLLRLREGNQSTSSTRANTSGSRA